MGGSAALTEKTVAQMFPAYYSQDKQGGILESIVYIPHKKVYYLSKDRMDATKWKVCFFLAVLPI